MAPEGDPTARYRELMDALGKQKTLYMFSSPAEDPEIEESMASLRDALVALLDDPANVTKIAADYGGPQETFTKARDAVRDIDVKTWKGTVA